MLAAGQLSGSTIATIKSAVDGASGAAAKINDMATMIPDIGNYTASSINLGSLG